MNLHLITNDTDYKTQRFDAIVALEESGNPHLTPYKDSSNWVTIGIGFNLSDAAVRAKVLAKLGFANPTLEIDLGNYLSKQRLESTATVQTDLNAIVRKYLPGQTFTFASTDPIKELFNGAGTDAGLAKIYEDRVDTWTRSNKVLGDATTTFTQSKERIALLSLSYNGVLGGKLAKAIKGDNRAEAWFEIRYGSNAVGMEHALGQTMSIDHQGKYSRGEDKGLAKRRDYEASLFGLYDDAAAPSEAEVKNVFGMLTQHRPEILKYENAYGTSRAGAAGDRGDQVALAVTSYANIASLAVAQTLIAALHPAKDWLLTTLAGKYSQYADKLTDATFLATNIYLGKSSVMANFDSAAFETGALEASNKNDLMIGDSKGDLLRGNKGNDVLIGEGGNDLLEGGAGADLLIGGDDDDVLRAGGGNDTLDGGDGDDTYVIDLREGPSSVTIKDSDHSGQIIVIGINGERLNTTVLQKQDAPNTWTDKDGKVTISHNSPWKLTLSDGSVIELGDNFDPLGFGISLQDKPAVTTTSYTGDFKKKVTDTYYAYFNNNYLQDGNLLEANAQDIITGSILADKIQGLGGNDALFGAAGDDVIEGGDGDDLLLGGMGQDTLNGGAGRDFIYGSAAGGLDHPLRTIDAPPVAPGPEYTRGLGWVTYDRGIDANGRKTYGIVGGGGLGTLSGDATSLIDGGAGDDWIIGRASSDSIWRMAA